jgi:hypothetical protein
MRRRHSRCALVLATLVAVALAVAGCGTGGSDQPSGPAGPAGPDITGIVWQVSADVDGTGSLLVVGLQGVDSAYDRASVAITPDTTWVLPSGGGDAIPMTDELVGRRVAVTFTGPVRESYPVQATADEVKLLEPLGVSMQVTPAGMPQVHGTAVELVRDEAGAVTALVVRPTKTPDTTRSIPVTAETGWLLATPSEFKSAPSAPLIGNGLEPKVDVRIADGAALWVAVMLPR